MEIVTSWMKEG